MPVLTAEGLGLRTRRGWIFRDVNLSVAGGDLVALTGDSGSGRTSLLLALAGHFALPRRRGLLRRGLLRRGTTAEGLMRLDGWAALGYVRGVYEPDPGLTVAEHVRERILLLGRRAHAVPPRSGVHTKRRRTARSAVAEALLAEFPGTPSALGRELTAYQRHRLMLGLATIGGPSVIAVDDVDVALDARERDAMWEALAALAASGYAVIVTARELEPGRPAIEYSLTGARA